MRHLCIFISLVFLNQISYAAVTIGSMWGMNSYATCTYQGTVINLNKIDSNVELLINTENNLDHDCSVPLNENIRLIVPENKEINIGSDVKFSATKIMSTKIKNNELSDITTTEYKFNHWE